jgi:hypothetical protein
MTRILIPSFVPYTNGDSQINFHFAITMKLILQELINAVSEIEPEMRQFLLLIIIIKLILLKIRVKTVKF